jgi:hypothetical protein
MPSCRAAAPHLLDSDETYALDLVGDLDIDGCGAPPNHRRQAPGSLTRSRRIVGQLPNLHSGSKHNQLCKIDALAIQASTQIIERFANRLRLRDGVARV